MTSNAHETLTLLQYAPCLGLRNASPFCMKGDALLALTGQPYVTEVFADPRKAPKGKLPVLRHRGKLIADSTFIRRYLEGTLSFDFDAGLSDAERATADAFVKLCEEHLYWVLFYSRWMEEANWPAIRDAYFADIPALVRPLITKQIRKAAFAAMQGHGLGRHTRSRDLRAGCGRPALARALLGRQALLHGRLPTSADATVYAWMSSILDAPLESPLKTAAQSHQNLVSYTQRAGQRLFG
jgi:glutathione S-transferase